MARRLLLPFAEFSYQATKHQLNAKSQSSILGVGQVAVTYLDNLVCKSLGVLNSFIVAVRAHLGTGHSYFLHILYYYYM